MLLTRDQFREEVFKRDRYQCVICKSWAQDAHHILERRLFDDGGYHLDNGASVCGQHHLEAEQTTLSCDEIRRQVGITQAVLPPHLYRDTQYDKWGNIIQEDGTRIPGELFYDESVQKILNQGGVLGLFQKYFKYPRTYHLPWSPGITDDDRALKDTSCFEGNEVVATLKMDGENTTMYPAYLHARSIHPNPHPSRDWVKNLHSKVCRDIPEGYRLCGENLYAKHSIAYQNLDSYFYLFSIWDKDHCLSWDSTQEWAELLGIPMVPVLYRGPWDEKKIRSLYSTHYQGNECEGYVVRVHHCFASRDFRKSVAKYVRKSHVQTHGHWMWSQLVLNELKKDVANPS